MPQVWDDEIAKQFKECLLAGDASAALAARFGVDVSTIRKWKRRMRKTDRIAWGRKPTAFLAESDAALQHVEQGLTAEFNDKDATASQKATLAKQILAARQARINLRKDVGIIGGSVTEDARDPSRMSDDAVKAEMKELEANISRLDPAKRASAQREKLKSRKRRAKVKRGRRETAGGNDEAPEDGDGEAVA